MKIWVDADACPRPVKDILFRAAERAQIETILVANQLLQLPRSAWVRAVQVPSGPDVADAFIVLHLAPGDLIITADIPLASQVIDAGGHALNPRGELYSVATIRQHLDMRNFMDALRASGVDTGGPPTLSQSDRQAFANQLDRFLARRPRPAAPSCNS